MERERLEAQAAHEFREELTCLEAQADDPTDLSYQEFEEEQVRLTAQAEDEYEVEQEQDSYEGYDEQDPNDDDGIGKNERRSDWILSTIYWTKMTAVDEYDDDMDRDQNSRTIDGDGSSTDQHASYGGPDSDDSDDDHSSDLDRDDSDCVQVDSDYSVDSTDQKDEVEGDDDFSDEEGSDVTVRDDTGDDGEGNVQNDDGEDEGLYQKEEEPDRDL
ncbi:hypothetical protein BG015_007067 [Linnemannia schmuckeri]|uniref:Uncharacterized protein n=1 Tax=Linnemannia schmuckeri TaxID=64567 RepID=A0A9P5RZE2_9FUNG|nr:hypothetical protein BG015_007067 [Linnemannia schmuckeri]